MTTRPEADKPRGDLFRQPKKLIVGALLTATVFSMTGCRTEAKQSNVPMPQANSYSAPADPSVENSQPPTIDKPAETPPTSTAPKSSASESQPYRVGDEISPSPEKLPEPKTLEQTASIVVGLTAGAIEIEGLNRTGVRTGQGNDKLQNYEYYSLNPNDLPAETPVGFVELNLKNADAGLIEFNASLFRKSDDGGQQKVAVGAATMNAGIIEALSEGWNARTLYQDAGLKDKGIKPTRIEIIDGGGYKIYSAADLAALSEKEKQYLIEEVMELLGEVTKDHRSSYVEYDTADVPNKEK